MDRSPKPPRDRPRSNGKWKLWQLAALVAVSAVLLTLERLTPGTLPSIGFVWFLFLPTIVARIAWDGLTRRLLRLCRLPRRSFKALLVKGALLLAFLWLFLRWQELVFRWFKDFGPK